MSLVQNVVDEIGERVALEVSKVRAEFSAGLTETLNALRVTATRPKAIIPNALNSNGAGRLVGWSVRETTGTAPALVLIYAGRDPGSDALIGQIPLAAGAAINHAWGVPGVAFGDGCYVAVTGAVSGSLLFGSVD